MKLIDKFNYFKEVVHLNESFTLFKYQVQKGIVLLDQYLILVYDLVVFDLTIW